MAISSIILAGGLGTRMGGVDKGWIQLQHLALVQQVVSRVAPQVDEILINANREIVQYQALGFAVLPDETQGLFGQSFIGPLAGFHAGLAHAQHDYLLTVPCDSPLLPHDLAVRLLANLRQHDADIAVATSDCVAHPVFSLCKKTVLPSLMDYLRQGGRKVSSWQKSLHYVEVDFSDVTDAFININTPDDLAALVSTPISHHDT